MDRRSLDDAEIRRLLIRTAARDAEAFERLYRLTLPLLLGVAQRVLGRRELAQEAVHDAFVKVWHAAGSFDPLAERATAWLVAVVRHRAIDLAASAEASRVDAAGDDIDAIVDRAYAWDPRPDDVLDSGRGRRWLRLCLDELQPGERQAIVLAYHHGLSHGELAAHLSRPLGTVKSWIRRGLESLRACVERHAGGVPR